MGIEWPVRLAHQPALPVGIFFAELGSPAVEPALPFHFFILQLLGRNAVIHTYEPPALLIDIPLLLDMHDATDLPRLDNIPHRQWISLTAMLRSHLDNLLGGLH